MGLENPDFSFPHEELVENTRVAYADIDASPTKAWMIEHRNDPQWKEDFELGFGKRPEEELYDLNKDPDYMHNVVGQPEYEAIRAELWKRLLDTLTATGDPRVQGDGKTFERPPFVE